MQNIKTPGVYIQEISKLPASVAPVATAIPAFVGYTKKRIRNREDIPKNTPIQIASLLEYEEIFGGAFEEPYVVTLEPDADDPEETKITITPEENELSPYLMHHCLRLFFGNGGGKCWIVSVGDGYEDDLGNVEILKDDLVESLEALAQEDEPTILVVPEAVELGHGDRKELHDAMLGQCEMLKDRFALFDVLVGDNNNSDDDAEVFRDNEVGMEALKYGAAYYPSLKTTIRRSYDEADVLIHDVRGEDGIGEYENFRLHELSIPAYKRGTIEIVDLENLSYGDKFKIGERTVTLVENDPGENEIEVKHGDPEYTKIRFANDLAELFKDSELYEVTKETDEAIINIKYKDEGADGDVVDLSYEFKPGATVVSDPEEYTWARIEIVNLDKLSYGDEFKIGEKTVTLVENGPGGNEIDHRAQGATRISIASMLVEYFSDEFFDESDEDEIFRVKNEPVIITKFKNTGEGYDPIEVSYKAIGDDYGATVLSDPMTYSWALIDIDSSDSLFYGDKFTLGDNTVTLVKDNPDNDDDKIAVNLDNPVDTEKEIADRLSDVFENLELYEAFKVLGEAYIIIKSSEQVGVGAPIKVLYEPNLGVTTSSDRLELSVPDTNLYGEINKELAKKRLTLYPSAAMAGVYARVDRNRGVWKAPANVSLNLVRKPSLILTDEEQAVLNVDANTGKSINAIRSFHGKGTIVWGARTLAGNDNEWRYIPVRRLFIFIEESIKKATEPVVFEPNDANTWARTRAMIENFLTGLWRDGALAGATTEEAFFVKVGLGETMSANDILEGRLIIDIGIAAVRPAEFIILQFMHKLQES